MLASIAALLSGHPARVLGHLQLYGDLMSAEAAHATRELLQRVIYIVLAVELLACGITLAGVAFLLAATVTGASGHWALWAVPAVPLIGALLAWLKLREGPPLAPFSTLRQQVASDAQWLAERERITQAAK
jgi:cytochrome bd-type quinol oxidase subunit 2